MGVGRPPTRGVNWRAARTEDAGVVVPASQYVVFV